MLGMAKMKHLAATPSITALWCSRVIICFYATSIVLRGLCSYGNWYDIYQPATTQGKGPNYRGWWHDLIRYKHAYTVRPKDNHVTKTINGSGPLLATHGRWTVRSSIFPKTIIVRHVMKTINGNGYSKHILTNSEILDLHLIVAFQYNFYLISLLLEFFYNIN